MKIQIQALAVVGVLALAGCSSSPQKAGAAAVVGDVAISESTVAAAVSQAGVEITSLPVDAIEQAPSLTQLGQMVIDRMVLSQLILTAAKTNNITTSNGEINGLLQDAYDQYGKEQILAQLVVQNGVSSDQLDEFGRDVVIQRKLMAALDPTGDTTSQSAALGAYLADLAKNVGVTLSPRYGTWSPDDIASIPGDNSLSIPVSAS